MGAVEPAFRTRIMQLERAAGLPGTDIRLAVEIAHETRGKLRELGLDPHDTNGPELYQALRAKLLLDEIQVRAALNIRADGTPLAVLEAAHRYLNKASLPAEVFALKQPVLRALLKKLKPAATMKRLGYRSLDSMIKHEPAAQLLLAASMTESAGWQHRRLAAYRNLQPKDFEVRCATFLMPTARHWPELAAEYTTKARYHIVGVPELGSVVLLPLERDLPGLAITTLLLAADGLNDMRSLSSYLKLQQVRPEFGAAFAQALAHEPLTAARLAGDQLPWKVLQWFYAKGHTQYFPDIFGPHVRPEDLTWPAAEDLLARLHPALEFWQGSQLLALLDSRGKAVSLNVLDVALAAANGLDYTHRVVANMRRTLGRELLARYLHQDNLQSALLGQLDQQLTPEVAY